MIPKIESNKLLVLNLGLGAFAGLANTAALAVVLSGSSQHLANKAAEMAAWAFAGWVLALTALFALIRKDVLDKVLKTQSYLVLAFVLLLSGWALSVIGSSRGSEDSKVYWAVGYLSALAFYCTILWRNVFPRQGTTIAFRVLLPACVVIDLATFWLVQP